MKVRAPGREDLIISKNVNRTRKLSVTVASGTVILIYL
jgi:hypothetical protein